MLVCVLGCLTYPTHQPHPPASLAPFHLRPFPLRPSPPAWQNLAARLALRTRVPAYLNFVATIIITWYFRLGTCTSYLLIWPGVGPMHVRASGGGDGVGGAAQPNGRV